MAADTGTPYTYNFEGGEILTVFGSNFDYQSTVLIGKRTGRTVVDSDPWMPQPFYDCGIPGTFYINSTRALMIECVFLLQNVFSCNRMCSPTIECVLLL